MVMLDSRWLRSAIPPLASFGLVIGPESNGVVRAVRERSGRALPVLALRLERFRSRSEVTSARPNSSIWKKSQPSPSVTGLTVLRVTPLLSIRRPDDDRDPREPGQEPPRPGRELRAHDRPARAVERGLASGDNRCTRAETAPAGGRVVDRDRHQDPACSRTPDGAPEPGAEGGSERLRLGEARLPARDVEELEVQAGLRGEHVRLLPRRTRHRGRAPRGRPRSLAVPASCT